MHKRYPELGQLIGGYFHEDYDLFGDNFGEVMDAYIEGSSPDDRAQVLKEIERFQTDNAGQLEAAYRKEFIDHIDLSLWGFTYTSFLEEIKVRVSASL
ncbi:hypothetical protein D3C81_1055650 [compost metagenome]|uniref:contact-dependent growth inhibition system immunity protein n=2 Tax=Pseudomonadota TaxID=1224 RepID=UPI000F97A7B3|nr:MULTISPECIES: contact-dependent growth inhibition system immunity protein [Cupriavidus]CAG2156762.1 hypothetical protein LMG19282_05303 [Cupriavidus campinensis]